MSLQLFMTDESTLHQLMEFLQKKCAGTSSNPDIIWTVGQACVAQYTLDDLFYRAQITDVTDKGIKVKYLIKHKTD